MKRFIFAVAAVALVASAGSAQETPPASPPVTAAPVVIGSAGPVVEATPVTTAPARRGLFGRLRGRSSTTTAMPVTSGTVVTPGTVITPATPTAPVPMPMPMPGTKGTMVTPTAPNGVVVAGGTVTSGTGDVLMPAMATATATTTAMPARRGLFGRLRNR